MAKIKSIWAVEKAPTTEDYALAYAKLGWHVLPVWSVDEHGQCRCGRPNNEAGHKPGKHPHAKLVPHGHHDATTDPELIRNWFTTDPDAGIGISLAESGLIALDIDPQNGGNESLEQLESQHGVLYSECTAITQGGGEHRLFKSDPELLYPGTLGAGLDLKHNGYICVAPTLGASGSYKWAAGKSPLSASNPAVPSALPSFIANKARPKTSYALVEHNGVPVATAQTFDDLRSALTHVDPDDYNNWVNVGMALRAYGENGYKVWTEWSARSGKFNADNQRRKWERDLSSAHSITYRSIFRQAIDAGWLGNSPKATSPVSTEPALEVHPLSLTKAVETGASTVSTFEYIFDDFMSTGVNVVAGAPGVGKTTLIVPLALATAHLCPSDHPLKPKVRRNVIIITESVVQVQRTIYSVANWGFTGMSAEDFDTRVKVIHAQRLDPAIVAQVADEYRQWTVDNLKADGTYYAALPLVVFDTANAVFDLENENDNSEVGRAMAFIKQSFNLFPVIIVAHAAKVNGMLETDGLSPRGASAWTGDAQGVYTVFKDGEVEESPRVMKATKVRFPIAYPELTFDLVTNRENHKDVLGYDTLVMFTHSLARALKQGERAQLKEDSEEIRNQKQWEYLCDDIINLVRKFPAHARSYYEQLTVAQGGVKGSRERKNKAISQLLEDGVLIRVEREVPVARENHYLKIDEEVLKSSQKTRFSIEKGGTQ